MHSMHKGSLKVPQPFIPGGSANKRAQLDAINETNQNLSFYHIHLQHLIIRFAI